MLPELITEVPGPRSRSCAKDLEQYECQNITFLSPDFPVFWDRAEGSNVWDVDGNRFLDLTSAFAIASLGHGRAEPREALIRQAGRLMHGMGDVHPTPLKAQLCQALSRITFERWGVGRGKVMLANSGFEAVEAAMKTAYLQTGKPGVITFTNAYHGLGYGSLSAGGIEAFRHPFQAQLADLRFEVPFPSEDDSLEPIFQRIQQGIREREIGAILVEPILGRGGKVVPPAAFLPGLRSICDDTGTLLILDEIYTGFNRTGQLFACEHTGTVPDLICLGKALTGGFPLSACVGRAALMDSAWPKSSGEALHTSSFLGNPMGCAMALASIEIHQRPETAVQVRKTEAAFRQRLESIQHPRRGKVRGRGLMLGLEILTPQGKPDGTLATQLILRGLKEGLILLADGPNGHVLALAPPFSITHEEMDFVTDRIRVWLNEAVV